MAIKQTLKRTMTGFDDESVDLVIFELNGNREFAVFDRATKDDGTICHYNGFYSKDKSEAEKHFKRRSGYRKAENI